MKELPWWDKQDEYRLFDTKISRPIRSLCQGNLQLPLSPSELSELCAFTHEHPSDLAAHVAMMQVHACIHGGSSGPLSDLVAEERRATRELVLVCQAWWDKNVLPRMEAERDAAKAKREAGKL
jgi:hypothetical protein